MANRGNRDRVVGDENTARDKFIGGVRHAIEATNELSVLQSEPAWAQFSLVLQGALTLADPSLRVPAFDRVRSGESENYIKLTKALQDIIEAATEVSVRRDDPMWLDVAALANKLLLKANQHVRVRAANRLKHIH